MGCKQGEQKEGGQPTIAVLGLLLCPAASLSTPQAILAAGMGPRRDTNEPRLMRGVVERLRRRLRARGFRANYNLQLVPQQGGRAMGVLQVRHPGDFSPVLSSRKGR